MTSVWVLSEAAPLFSMLGDPRPGHGLIGVSDPDVHRRDHTWTMFLGAFTTRFAVRIVEARLPAGAPITAGSWHFVTGRRRRAVELGAPPDRRCWDAAGMHTPSYVRGPGTERIYYAGRRSRKITGPDSRYAIGFLEHRDGAWHRHPTPVLTGDPARPSALEPFVLHTGGRWRMWFLSAIGEVGPGEQPDYELRYTESDDGVRWDTPETFAAGFFDNTVLRDGERWRMVLARGTNLYGTTPFPGQGLWLTGATDPAGRAAWSAPRRLLDTDAPRRPLDTDAAAEPWYAAGVCGPAVVTEGNTMHVFATGTHASTPWKAALGRLRAGRSLPAPAPYFLTTGRFTFHRADGPS